MRGTSVYRRREEKEKPKARTLLANAIIVVIIAVVAFFLAGFAVDQFDLYNLLGLDSAEIPRIEASIPEWVLQLVLALIIFFILQPIVVIVLDLFGLGKKKDEISEISKGQWKR